MHRLARGLVNRLVLRSFFFSFFLTSFAIISTHLLKMSEVGKFPWNWFLGIEPISLAGERIIHLWCVYMYVLHKMSSYWTLCGLHAVMSKCTRKCAVCADWWKLSCKLYIAFLMSLLLLPLLLLQLPILIWMTQCPDIRKNPKFIICIIVKLLMEMFLFC